MHLADSVESAGARVDFRNIMHRRGRNLLVNAEQGAIRWIFAPIPQQITSQQLTRASAFSGQAFAEATGKPGSMLRVVFGDPAIVAV
jgi:hypothetical protein